MTQNVARSATLIYTGDYFAFTTTSPNLGALVDQGAATPFVDFSAAATPVWERFRLTGPATRTLWTQVNRAPSWTTTGFGIGSTSTTPLPAGTYTVTVDLVSADTSTSPNPYVIATPITANLVVSAMPLSGTFVTGSGSIPVDSSANTATRYGAYSTSVSYSSSTGLAGNLSYRYLVNMDIGGGNLRNVWITTTSTSLRYLGVTMTSSLTGRGIVTGTATVKYTDQASGAAYTQFDQSAALFELTVTDNGTTGDQYAIAIRYADGTLFHASTLPYSYTNGSATPATISSGSITVRD
jgi:hypothetical protein